MKAVGDYVYYETDKIGQGAFGKVYKGHNKTEIKKVVAIKQVDVGNRKLAPSSELIEREIDILKMLSDLPHENIVTLLHCGQQGDQLYFVMEFCNGGNLAEYLESKKKLDERTLSLFLRQIAAGLKAAHDQGIIHRDLKPENILLCFSGTIYPEPSDITLKIADFGLGKVLLDEETESICGTPLYMAPEVYAPRPYGYKVDLWSTGVIAYECLMGPLPKSTLMELIRRFKMPKGLSPALEDLLKRLLEKDDNKRLGTNHFCIHPFLDATISELSVSKETTKQVKNYAVVVGLSDDLTVTNDVIKINLYQSNKVSTVEQMPTAMQSEAFTAVYCNTVYTTGVGDKCDEIWKYTEISGWKKCAPLVQGRRRHSAAFIDEVLYICGGFVESNKRVLDSVEAYNAIDDKCTTVGKLVHCVHNSGNCVPFESSLYIFGGLNADNKSLNYVQVYNAKQNTCTLLTEKMPRGYSHMRAVLWHTSIILLGPYTCLLYDTETESCRKRGQFKSDVIHCGLVHENGQIFVIGGASLGKDKDGKDIWKCRDDVRYVPLQDIIDDKPVEWMIHGKLPRPSFVYASGIMQFSSST